MKDIKLEKSWKNLLHEEFEKEYFQKLTEFVRSEYSSKKVYPHPSRIFAALDACKVDDVKVVILGQDPYHGPGQANGLSFSVNDGVPLPPSLKNIFIEIKSDLDIPIPNNGNLMRWAEQGVLLLNATLTVRASSPGSHQNIGWEEFTDCVVKNLSEKKENLVFLLWGSYAQRKSEIINKNNDHLILKATHPSPFSVHKGFFGCGHFSKTNNFLVNNSQKPIDW